MITRRNITNERIDKTDCDHLYLMVEAKADVECVLSGVAKEETN